MRTAFVYSDSWKPGLHIGAARLALLNWIFAAKGGDGKLVLFCDDTGDGKKRLDHTLYTALQFIGIGRYGPANVSIEGPYFARHFAGYYHEVCEQLLQSKLAYLDYSRPDEIHSERLVAQAKGVPFLYSRRYAAYDKSAQDRWTAEGRQPVLRLKMPRNFDGVQRDISVVLDDKVMGTKTYSLANHHDYIIRDVDGRYTSFLTRPVNYHYHKIDLVIADRQHLDSIPAQLFIGMAASLKTPQFAHIPPLSDPSSNRRFSERTLDKQLQNDEFRQMYERCAGIDKELSSPNGPILFHPCSVDFYRRVGFLPETLIHYLLASATVSHSFLRTKGMLNIDTVASHLELRHLSTESETFDAKQIMLLQKDYMNKCRLPRKAWWLNRFLRSAGMSRTYPVMFPEFPGDCMDKPTNDLLELATTLGPKLILAGDVVQLTDYFDCRLKPRDLDLEIQNFVSEGCPNA